MEKFKLKLNLKLTASDFLQFFLTLKSFRKYWNWIDWMIVIITLLLSIRALIEV